MKKRETREDYLKRIARVEHYIVEHLDEDIYLAQLAEVSNFSEYHFHRIFKALRGETLGGYLTRLRMEAAANMLLHSDLPVEEIAFRVGYDIPSSFSKSFRQFFGASPTDYRSTQKPYVMKTQKEMPRVELKAPKIVELEPKTVICLPFEGDYSRVDYGGAFARLWAQVKTQGLFTAGIEHLAIFHNDPKVTEQSELRTDVCLAVHKPAVAVDGVEVRTVAGGRYAVFTHIGPYNEVGPIYDAIYGEWVPANCTCEDCDCGDDCTCILRDEPVFEKYCNDPSRTASEKLRTEIYLPIK
jgi:AraC family transcriptional regulator